MHYHFFFLPHANHALLAMPGFRVLYTHLYTIIHNKGGPSVARGSSDATTLVLFIPTIWLFFPHTKLVVTVFPPTDVTHPFRGMTTTNGSQVRYGQTRTNAQIQRRLSGKGWRVKVEHVQQIGRRRNERGDIQPDAPLRRVHRLQVHNTKHCLIRRARDSLRPPLSIYEYLYA